MIIETLVTFLTPFLPSLLNLGSKVFDGVLEEMGADAWNKAKSIWSTLSPRLQLQPSAQEAATDLATTPDDTDLQAAFRVQLKKLLKQEPELAEAIEKILNENGTDGTPGTQIVQRVIGNYNQTIAQNFGTAINTVRGDVHL